MSKGGLLFLVIMCLGLVAHAQYDDDTVVVHSNRKPSKKDTAVVIRKVPLTGIALEGRIPSMSAITIVNAVSDSSLLGYMQKGLFNKWVEAVADKPFTEYLQSYVDSQYGPFYKKDAPQLVWVIQELRVGERTFNMRERAYLHLKAIAFAGNGDNFKLMKRMDTVLASGAGVLDVTHLHGENIMNALNLLAANPILENTTPGFSLEQIKEKVMHRYQRPGLLPQHHEDGIYMTYGEFINDQPSIKNIAFTEKEEYTRVYYMDNGVKKYVYNCWGVRIGGQLYRSYSPFFLPVTQKQYSLVLSNYIPSARHENSEVIRAAFLGPRRLENRTAATEMPEVLDYHLNRRSGTPYATGIDIETGEFTL